MFMNMLLGHTLSGGGLVVILHEEPRADLVANVLRQLRVWLWLAAVAWLESGLVRHCAPVFEIGRAITCQNVGQCLVILLKSR